MAVLECYESSHSKDIKSLVVSVLDEILAGKPVFPHPIDPDPEIPADEPPAMRSRLETIVPAPVQTQLREVVRVNINHPVPTTVRLKVSVEMKRTLCSKPPCHTPPTPRTSTPDIPFTSSPDSPSTSTPDSPSS